jgi:O-antigen/teichoic acid export membrane protein
MRATEPTALPAPGLGNVFRSAGLLVAGKAAAAVLGLANLALAARALGVEAFGLLVLADALRLGVGEVAKFQSWQAVLRYGAPALADGDRPRLQRTLRFTLLLDGVGAVAGAAAAVAAALLAGPRLGFAEEAVPLAAAYATSVVFSVAATPTGVLRLFGRFDALALQSTAAPLLRTAGAAAGWATGAGLGWFLLVWYVSAALSFALLARMAFAEARRGGHLRGYRWRAPGLTAGLPGIWRFAAATNANATLETAFGHAATLAVGLVLGPAAAALFRIARQFADAVAKPAKLLVPAIYPDLARLAAAGGQADLRRLVVRGALLAGAGATALLGAAAAWGDDLLALAVGPEFRAAGETMVWLVAAATLSIWIFPLEPFLISTGRAGRALAIRAAVSAAYAPALVWLLLRVGVEGAGIAAVLAEAVMAAAFLAAAVPHLRTAPAASPG